jgi:lipopolysaccharide export system permease protein
VNSGGEKLAKSGTWNIAFGVWLSSIVLTPIGVFLTYKANQDSAVFNMDGYRMFIMRLFGLRESRKLNRKEVIIHDPDYPSLCNGLSQLQTDCKKYTEEHHLVRMPNYWRIFFEYEEDAKVIDIDQHLEHLVEELHNSRDKIILGTLNELPVLVPDAHTRPFHDARRNMVAGILLPVGLFFYLRIWRYRLRLLRDMNVIEDKSQVIIDRIEKLENESN